MTSEPNLFPFTYIVRHGRCQLCQTGNLIRARSQAWMSLCKRSFILRQETAHCDALTGIRVVAKRAIVFGHSQRSQSDEHCAQVPFRREERRVPVCGGVADSSCFHTGTPL
ncbi:hypothetical protein AAFF_G00056820 [Aldrovandia affinis]|uniref:Uncharacterized protein n=1 Tax=Aldrovandia affinis TaxID=143900 RepID=A0AAD7S0M0_9TELE|nr:hypothetical protein AAFF_G00056820 [Aldrovandia affinis]